MVLHDGFSFRWLSYNHCNVKNYQTSLRDGIMPPGLKFKKKLVFEPVSHDFKSKSNSILFDAEKLVHLSLIVTWCSCFQ